MDTSLIVQRAIAWALESEGSADLYVVANSTGEPPPGAFVFFSTTGAIDGVTRDWGHVGLAIGDGRMVHTWPEVRIDQIRDVPLLAPGAWSAPVYLGFAPPSRILEGHRDRRSI